MICGVFQLDERRKQCADDQNAGDLCESFFLEYEEESAVQTPVVEEKRHVVTLRMGCLRAAVQVNRSDKNE